MTLKKKKNQRFTKDIRNSFIYFPFKSFQKINKMPLHVDSLSYVTCGSCFITEVIKAAIDPYLTLFVQLFAITT